MGFLSVQETADLCKSHVSPSADQVYESHTEEAGIAQCILVYQRYFLRNSNYAAMTVVIDNLGGKTKVTVVATGGSGSLLTSWDWGAASDWLSDSTACFSDYIVNE
ncbi:DUF6054 family protein [Sporolactobacillus sp. CPB3-1]|uniref:DUF6054 family protein n=1 Tax=Sporolactobacillus mangiferae TaxID=2940498 RepID=A0ABT0MBK1_9BACL|nr:DUF6054 family protein [Sporolactobacillus mangiferae]MCL1632232.1 DUF6054 family protein [Sporolactobacillus mangiferae]